MAREDGIVPTAAARAQRSHLSVCKQENTNALPFKAIEDLRMQDVTQWTGFGAATKLCSQRRKDARFMFLVLNVVCNTLKWRWPLVLLATVCS